MATEKSAAAVGSLEESVAAPTRVEDTFGVAGFALFGFMVIPVAGDPFASGSGYAAEESAAAVTKTEESRA